jgi:hypothetical protein
VRLVSLIYNYKTPEKDAAGLWAVMSLKDGMVFEGIVINEAPHGIYLSIGGNQDRLSLFPWHQVSRVVYKEV